MDTSLPLDQTSHPNSSLVRLPAFWLGLLALLVLGLVETRFISWCWPVYGESACTRYSLPLTFLLDLAFFLLVVLVFDRRWWIVLVAGVLAVVAYHAGSLPRLAQNVSGGEDLRQSLVPLFGWTFMALYLALPRFILPAGILRWLARRAGGLTGRIPALFGIVMAAFAAAYHIALFGSAGLLSPGSVAPGFIFTPRDLAGALLSGLAGWLAAMIGSKLRTRTR